MGGGGFIPWPQRPFPEDCGDLDPWDDYALLEKRAAPKAFPRRGWNPDLLALSVLAEFGRLDWRAHIKLEAPPPLDDSSMAAEARELVRLWKEVRPQRKAEIRDQNALFHDWFAHLLMITPASHHDTFNLFKSGARVGEMLMVVYKLEHERPRPQQVFPGLVPLLDAPGHSSYPSGHALISRLIALCLVDVAPHAKDQLYALAERIGRNREIAGLHFRSDTEAGFAVADQAHPLLRRCESYDRILERAKREWLDERHSNPPALNPNSRPGGP